MNRIDHAFRVDIIDLPPLKRIDGEQRYYELPTGNLYPSVTTVLSAMTDKTAIHEWRARVGAEAADKITNRATRRGTAVHKLCESLVLNQEVDLSQEMPINIDMYKQLERFLINNVDDIRSSEGFLYSNKLRVAGSVDLVASYRGKPAIIDFKTSTRSKRRDWIESYFLQAAMYSFMWWERTQLHHPKIIIAIAIEEEDSAQIFEDCASKWIGKAKHLCDKFHDMRTTPEF